MVRCSLLIAVALSTVGCHGFLDAGYVNTGKPRGAGGSSLALRVGTGDLRDSGAGFSGLDVGLRGDFATSGSRFALGSAAVLTTQADWDHTWTPIARAGFWYSPARSGPAEEASAFAPSIDLGALLYGSNATHDRGLTMLGTRIDYAHHPDGFGASIVWMLYVGFGTSHSFNCCS